MKDDSKYQMINCKKILESCNKGIEIPNSTTIGINKAHLRKFDRVEYIKKIHKIMYKKQTIRINNLNHYLFVAWFENDCADQYKSEYLNEYVFSLSALGLGTGAQKERVKNINFDPDSIITRKPNPKFYPPVLPLDIYQLLKNIHREDGERQWRHNLAQSSKLLSLFWQSKRIPHIDGKLSGEFSFSYLSKHIGLCERRINKHLSLLEKYKLIGCVNHGFITDNGTKVYNRFKLNNGLVSVVFPLVFVAADINLIDNYDCYDRAQKALADRKYRFYLDTRFRRMKSANSAKIIKNGFTKHPVYEGHKQTSTQGDNHGIYPFNSRTSSHYYWYHIPESKQLIIEKTEREINAIKLLVIDRQRLKEDILLLEHYLKATSIDRLIQKFTHEIRICNDLLHNGIRTDFDYTASGRLKPHGYANHLLCSKTWGKKGYSFWRALHENSMYETDIKSAEPLVASIISGDKILFDDIMQEDIYSKALKEVHRGSSETRGSVKELWLKISYGHSIRVFKKNEPLRVQSFINQREYMKNRYPKFWARLQSLMIAGKLIFENDWKHKLPNEFPVSLDPDRPYGLPSHIMQAYVTIITAKMFIELDKNFYLPIFDRHDSVISSKKPEYSDLNNLVRDFFHDIITGYCLDWKIPDNARLIEIKELVLNDPTNQFS